MSRTPSFRTFARPRTAPRRSPVVRRDYRVGVPEHGYWREIVNTDAGLYGGSDVGNSGGVSSVEEPSHGRPYSVSLTLPPLATLMLRIIDE